MYPSCLAATQLLGHMPRVQTESALDVPEKETDHVTEHLCYYYYVWQYLDYMITCPILTLDLLWTLNLPYKVTYT